MTPFVVLFLGRTGSTYLVEALDAHPDVYAEYEEMATLRERGCDAPEQLAHARQALTWSSEHRAVGFKSKPSDVLDPAGFASLLQEVGARVIVLRRRNLVKLTVSWLHAERIFARTGDWNLYAKADSTTQRLSVDTEVFASRLRDVERGHEALAAYAEEIARPTLWLYYEDLLSNRDRTLAVAFDFLGVDAMAAKGRTVKATPDDLRLAVENFDELRRAYVGTRFEWMFDEVPVRAA